MVKIVAVTDKRCLSQQRAYKAKGKPPNPHLLAHLAPRVKGLDIPSSWL
jgi:hypothetical protein